VSARAEADTEKLITVNLETPKWAWMGRRPQYFILRENAAPTRKKEGFSHQLDGWPSCVCALFNDRLLFMGAYDIFAPDAPRGQCGLFRWWLLFFTVFFLWKGYFSDLNNPDFSMMCKQLKPSFLKNQFKTLFHSSKNPNTLFLGAS